MMQTSHLALGLAHEALTVVRMPKAYSDEWWLCRGHLSFCLQKTEQVPGGHSLSKDREVPGISADMWLSCPELRARTMHTQESTWGGGDKRQQSPLLHAIRLARLERTLKIYSFLYLVTKITLCSDSLSVPSTDQHCFVGDTEDGFYSWRPQSMCPPSFLHYAQFPGLLATTQVSGVFHLLSVPRTGLWSA